MQKYRRVYATINLDAIAHNLAQIKSLLEPGVGVMAVLKADAYGHGAVQVAQQLENYVDCIGVSIIEEALELRKSGIQAPILIFGYTSPDWYDELLDNDIAQTVFSVQTAAGLSEAAVRNGKTAHIHLEVDTGMSRLGFKDDDSGAKDIKKIVAMPQLEVAGIYSHFACADSADKTCQNAQKDRFARFITALESMDVHIPVAHMCNSAAIIDDAEHYDIVRLGLAMYGLFTSKELHRERVSLIPAMELKTHVVFIKTVPPGCGVSYGHTYITEKPTKIATIPVGYADGYPRALSAGGRVLINGCYAPIIGRICMDLMMVDITDIKDVVPENEVTLVGTEGENDISIDELAEICGVLNYEIICGISKRVPKVFVKGGKEVLFLSSFED